MSRKDYELIAAAIGREAVGTEPLSNANIAIAGVALRIADALAAANPRFNKHRFLTACEVASAI